MNFAPRLALSLLTLMVWNTPAHASGSLDVDAWLQRPGVKLLAVEFYATWCKPCMEAVPRWRKLHEKYREQGLRLVVVATQDPAGGCVNPGWAPDDVICDDNGRLAERFGASKLPAAFLWSWQGNLLVRKGHVSQVEKKIEGWLGNTPRVDVEVSKLSKKSGIETEALANLVRSKLRDQDKLTVVATEAERKKLQALKQRSFKDGRDARYQCEVGQEISANSLLQISITGRARARLQMNLLSAERGCLVASSVVDWRKKRVGASVAEGVAALIQKMKQRAKYPFSKQSAGAAQAEVASVGVSDEREIEGVNLSEYDQLDDEIRQANAKAQRKEVEQQKLREALKRAWPKVKRYAQTQSIPAERRVKVLRKFLDDFKEDNPQHAEAEAMIRGLQNLSCRTASDCYTMGVGFRDGKYGKSKDVDKAIAHFDEACKQKHLESCAELGLMYAGGKGVTRDLNRARTLYKQACTMGGAKGCTFLADLYDTGTGGTKNLELATKYYEKGCSGGHARGCTNLGFQYRQGRGIAPNDYQAYRYYKKGCDGGYVGGCVNLGFLHEKGIGVAKDAYRALSLYSDGCRRGNARGCNNAGSLYEGGKGISKNYKKAKRFYKQACDGNHYLACNNEGVLYALGRGVPKDTRKAVALYQKACKGGDGAGCTNLGYRYEVGDGIGKNLREAKRYYELGCSKNYGRGCSNLGVIYQYAKGVRANIGKARSFYKKACGLGYKKGCSRAKKLR